MTSFQQETFNAMPLMPWGIQNGFINQSYQQSWYRVDLWGSNRLTLELTGNGPEQFDGQLAVYDAQGNLLASDDDSSLGTNAWLQVSSHQDAPVTYYVSVSGYQSNTGSYQISCWLEPAVTGETVSGGDYTDYLYDPTPGDDLLQGQAGNDSLTSAMGKDTLDGGTGDDSLQANQGGKLLLGGDGNDSLNSQGEYFGYGGQHSGGSTLDGGAGDDWLLSQQGGDTLIGGTGFDVMYGNWRGNTYVFNAGDGHDRIDMSEPYSYQSTPSSLFDPYAKETAVIQLGEGLQASNLDIFGDGFSDLHLTFPGPNGVDSITLQGWFRSPSPQPLELQFADGSVLSGEELWEMTFAQRQFNAMPVNPDQPLAGSSYNNEARWYMIPAEQGQSLQFELSSMNGSGSLLFLYDAQGHLLAQGSSDGAATNQLGWTPTSTQPLYLVVASASNWNPLDFSINISHPEGINLAGVTLAEGSAGNDDLDGSDSNDLLIGAAGNDSLHGGSGDDLISGGTGNDLLDGGAGSDTYILERGFGQDTLSASGWEQDHIQFGPGITSNDLRIERYWPNGDTSQPAQLSIAIAGGIDRLYIDGDIPQLESLVLHFSSGEMLYGPQLLERQITSFGTDGADNLYGTMALDSLAGGNGDDFLHSGPPGWMPWGADTLDGGAGNDYLISDGSNLLLGGSGNDMLEAYWGNATLNGGADDDQLNGGWGDNLLLGGSGNDTLIAGGGDDTLDGGSGNDWLDGGYGADSYRLQLGMGQDRLMDWDMSTILVAPGLKATDVQLQLHWSSPGSMAQMAIGLTGTDDRLIFEPGMMPDLQVQFSDGTAWYPWQLKNMYFVGTGTGMSDILDGSNGRDSISGGDGNDMLRDGTDTYAMVDDILDGGSGNDNLTAYRGNDLLLGGDGNDFLFGGDDNDTLDGGTGTDLLFGDAGMDSYWLRPGGGEDIVFDNDFTTILVDPALSPADIQLQLRWEGSGNAPQLAIVINGSSDGLLFPSFTPGQSLPLQVQFADGTLWSSEMLQSMVYIGNGTDGNDTLQGSEARDSISGGEGDDFINSGSGDDSLLGGNGNDLLAGADGNDSLDGGAGNDLLSGDSGNDTLNGGAGDDQLDGNIGSDTYVFNTGFGHDTLWLDKAGELDTLVLHDVKRSDLSFVRIGSDLQILTRAGDSLLLAGYANGSALELILDDGSHLTRADLVDGLILTGTSGNDILKGGSKGDLLYGLQGNDQLLGYDGRDNLDGGDGNDTLNGGLGADILNGGAGDDSYYVDDSADQLIELAAAGNDRVYSSVSLTLGENLENLILTGSASINGFGNALTNSLTGNTGNNQLYGGDGNDTFNGGLGADTMDGGAGNDTYTVDDAGDQVIDTQGGTDRVSSSVSFALGEGLEHLTLTGSASINGSGNALANNLTGNTGNNQLDGGDGNDTLNGGLGADTMDGGAGNDTYYVDNSADLVIDLLGGADRVSSSVSFVLGAGLESLTLTGADHINGSGNDLANSLTGNTGNNLLDGGDGNDTLSGGTGDDTLTGGAGRDAMNGGAGSDLFVFASITDSGLTSTTRDSISGFVSGADRLDLSALDADSASGGDQAFGSLIIGNQAFTAAGQLKLVSGVLYANTDADADAEFSIGLSGVTTLALSDFVL